MPAKTRARVPKGAIDGGRFAVSTRHEPGIALDTPASDGAVDKYGFPVIKCHRCDGTGQYGYNTVDATKCYSCGGTGHQYTQDVLTDVVAEFAAAQRAAARPSVRELKVGDTISRQYTQLADAHFKEVARVLVAPQRPTRFEGKGPAKRPAGFVAAVEFTDGSRDVVTTDTVYARRGAVVDPTPFVKRATKRRRSVRRLA